METLTIHVPDTKSELVKQILAELGVTIDAPDSVISKNIAYKEALTKVSVWTDEEVKVVEEAGKHFNFKPAKW